MKKLCMVLSLLALVALTGCGKGVPAGTGQKLQMIGSNVEESKELMERTQELIEKQISESTQTMEEAEEARNQGQVYQKEDDIEEIRQMHEEMLELRSQIQAMKEEVEELPANIGVEQIDLTYEAAKTYFEELDGAYGDLLAIFDFYFSYYDATKPIREFDASGYSGTTSMEIMWNNIQEVTDDMKKIDCPVFMEQTYKKYIEQMENYQALLQTAYMATALQDPLRTAATGNMSVRADYQLYTTGNDLTNDFNLQFEKVSERMSGRLGTLGEELIDGCKKLKKAL